MTSRGATAFLSVLTISLLSVAGCAKPAEDQGATEPAATTDTTSSRADDQAAFEKLVTAWDQTLNAGDVDGALAIYTTDDPIAMPPDQPIAIGTDAVRKVLEGIVSLPGHEVHNQMEDFRVDGDMAALRGTYTVSTTPEGGETTTVTGKWVAEATRGADGAWKTALNIWNLDAPAPAPAGP